MSATFTPGPWRQVERSPFVYASNNDGFNRWSALLQADWSACEQDELEANARLIAAAPDLYEALRDMLAGWRYIRQSHGDLYGVGWDRAQGKAEAAIAAATGKPGEQK
jgi:hypothetical protein